MSGELFISDIHSLNRETAVEILMQIARAERKTFPTTEAMSYGEELWRKKPNTRVLFASFSAKGRGASSPPAAVAGYAVYVRQKGTALLHKICVAEHYRRQGVGRSLLQHVLRRLEKEGCQSVQLWVDKARLPARALYTSAGFEEREQIENYYAPGRTGIRMVHHLAP